MALPTNSEISIHYTTDGSSPTAVGSALYDGPFRVPSNCRIVSAIAASSAYGLSSETIRIPIPQKGQEARTLDLIIPSRWVDTTKLDDSGAVWDFIQRLSLAADVSACDVSLTAESSDGQQNVDYAGVLETGYGATSLRSIAEKLQDIVGGGSLRMAVGSLAFPTGQALLDWLKANKISFSLTKVIQ
jgi:hypothetical protein